jgi:hypothetical protein
VTLRRPSGEYVASRLRHQYTALYRGCDPHVTASFTIQPLYTITHWTVGGHSRCDGEDKITERGKTTRQGKWSYRGDESQMNPVSILAPCFYRSILVFSMADIPRACYTHSLASRACYMASAPNPLWFHHPTACSSYYPVGYLRTLSASRL